MTEIVYTPTQVCKLTGIPIRQLIYMNDLGAVTPVIDASGKGSKRKYSKENLVQVRLFLALGGIGFDLKKAAEMIKSLDVMRGGVHEIKYPEILPIIVMTINLDLLLAATKQPVPPPTIKARSQKEKGARVPPDADRALDWKCRLAYAGIRQIKMSWDLKISETKLNKILNGWYQPSNEEAAQIEEYLPQLPPDMQVDIDNRRRHK